MTRPRVDLRSPCSALTSTLTPEFLPLAVPIASSTCASAFPPQPPIPCCPSSGWSLEPQLWHVFSDSSGDASVSHLQSLSEHKSAVNAVRFDPDGTRLASGADSGELFLWTECSDQHAQTTEWRLFAKLLGHQDDLQDISWSPDGSALASASVENMCIVWDMGASRASQSAPSKNKQCMPIGKLPGHEHWVQGVAWDPLGELIATMCGDRCCRVYGSPNPRDINKSLKDQMQDITMQATIKHTDLELPMSRDQSEQQQQHKAKQRRFALFLDDTLPSFFRRLAWSPDGSFLVAPTGVFKDTHEGAHKNVTHLFKRNYWSKPLLQLPGVYAPTIVTRFCPALFKKSTIRLASQRGRCECQGNQGNELFDLPYRAVFAVATTDSVLVYDTCEAAPLVMCGQLHLASITDLAWASDGSYLTVASCDGFVSFIRFEEGELGERAHDDDVPSDVLHRLRALNGMCTI